MSKEVKKKNNNNLTSFAMTATQTAMFGNLENESERSFYEYFFLKEEEFLFIKKTTYLKPASIK